MAAASAFVLTGCTETDLSSDTSLAKESAPSAIEFSAKTGNTAATRTVVTKTYDDGTGEAKYGTIGNGDDTNKGITDLKKARFGVFAYHTTSDYVITPLTSMEPNFMYNQEVMFDNEDASGKNAWIYSPVKYWPNGIDSQNEQNAPSNTATEVLSGGKLSFFAFAPYTAASGSAYSYTSEADTKPTAIGATTTNDNKVKLTGKSKGVTAVTTNDWNGHVWVKYALGTEAKSANESNFVDLLWGTRGSANYDKAGSSASDGAIIGKNYNINLTKQTVDERVSFLFKHALAKVGGATAQTSGETTDDNPARGGFKVVVDVDGNDGDNQGSYFPAGFNQNQTLVTIEEVKIQDGYTAGQDATVTTVANTEKSNLNTYGWFNIETGQWCNDEYTYGRVGDNGARYEVVANNDKTLNNDVYLLNKKILEIGARKHDVSGEGKELAEGGATWTSGTEPSGVGTTPVDLFANENVPALMLIPGGSADLYVTVTYYVRTADPALNAGFTSVKQTITNKVSLGDLNPNKFYTIIMHIGLTSVKFEAVVADWATNSTEAYDEKTGEDKSTGEANEKKVWLPSNVVALTRTYDALAAGGTYTFDGSALGLGNFVSAPTGTIVTAAAANSADAKKADLTIAAYSSGTEPRSETITLTYELGKVILTITQAAPVTP